MSEADAFWVSVNLAAEANREIRERARASFHERSSVIRNQLLPLINSAERLQAEGYTTLSGGHFSILGPEPLPPFTQHARSVQGIVFLAQFHDDDRNPFGLLLETDGYSQSVEGIGLAALHGIRKTGELSFNDYERIKAGFLKWLEIRKVAPPSR